MPITIKTGYLNAKDENGEFIRYNTVAEDVAGPVKEWLDEHPEATTSVQDGSLTYKKLATGTLGFVTPEMFGAVGDGVTDDYSEIVEAVDYCIENSQTLRFESPNGYLIGTPLVIEEPIDIIMETPVIYKGSGTAITIGKSGANNTYRNKRLVLRADSKNGLSVESGSVGIKLINIMECDVQVDSINCFDTGLMTIGDGYANSYNLIKLGVISNTNHGLIVASYNSGWVNENLYLSGRFFDDSQYPDRDEYVAITIDGSSGSPCNNNVFVKPCFEGANIGIKIEAGQYNRFISVRSEGTATVLETAQKSDNYNVVTVGYGNVSENQKSSTSVVLSPELESYANMEMIFDSGNFADYCYSNASWMYVGKELCGVNSSYAQTQSYAGKRYSNYINLTLPLGIMVDTSLAKRFAADIGCIEGSDSRLTVLMFDSNNAVISSGLIDGSQVSFSERTYGGISFLTADATCLNKKVLFEVPSNCVKAFIGFTGGSVKYTRFRVFANRFCTIFPTTAAKGLSSIPTCEAVAGDFCPCSSPSGGTLGWVCTGGSNWTAIST